MKYKLNRILTSVLTSTVVLIVFSCVDPDDNVTANASEGGAVLTVSGSAGKVTGVPDEDGVITFADTQLSMKINTRTGGDDVEGYQIVKSFNGGAEVAVAEFGKEDLPYTLTLTELDEFLEGTGKASTDLRIGDYFNFRVKMTTADGRVLYAAPNAGQYRVTVNCSSALAGSYTVTGIYNRPASGINGQAVGPRTETVTELSPGVYATTNTGHWANADLGFDPCSIIFSDLCGVLTISEQNLCDAYSNLVSGSGTVDPATGNLHFEYIITGGNERSYVIDFVKE